MKPKKAQRNFECILYFVLTFPKHCRILKNVFMQTYRKWFLVYILLKYQRKQCCHNSQCHLYVPICILRLYVRLLFYPLKVIILKLPLYKLLILKMPINLLLLLYLVNNLIYPISCPENWCFCNKQNVLFIFQIR